MGDGLISKVRAIQDSSMRTWVRVSSTHTESWVLGWASIICACNLSGRVAEMGILGAKWPVSQSNQIHQTHQVQIQWAPTWTKEHENNWGGYSPFTPRVPTHMYTHWPPHVPTHIYTHIDLHMYLYAHVHTHWPPQVPACTCTHTCKDLSRKEAVTRSQWSHSQLFWVSWLAVNSGFPCLPPWVLGSLTCATTLCRFVPPLSFCHSALALLGDFYMPCSTPHPPREVCVSLHIARLTSEGLLVQQTTWLAFRKWLLT